MWITLGVILIVCLDQISKYFAAKYLMEVDSVTFVNGLLSFQYHENKGAAWGMLSEHRWVFMLASVIAILGVFGYLIYCTKKQIKISFLQNLSLTFIVAGGIANMIDRVRLGYVVDFLRFDFIDFPIFNVADSFISVGAVLLFIALVSDYINDKKHSDSASKPMAKENDHA